MAKLTAPISIRLPQHMADKVTALAEARHITTSDVIRRMIFEALHEPSGYRCEHVSIESIPGVLRLVSAGCGCRMLPFYEEEAA